MCEVYITCEELQERTGFTRTRAQKTIREANSQMRSSGNRVFRGKTSRRFLEQMLGIDLGGNDGKTD